VLLHTPTTRAHELAAEGRADEFHAALSTLYGLSAGADTASDAATA
jgi:glutamyl-tRNA reductase